MTVTLHETSSWRGVRYFWTMRMYDSKCHGYIYRIRPRLHWRQQQHIYQVVFMHGWFRITWLCYTKSWNYEWHWRPILIMSRFGRHQLCQSNVFGGSGKGSQLARNVARTCPAQELWKFTESPSTTKCDALNWITNAKLKNCSSWPPKTDAVGTRLLSVYIVNRTVEWFVGNEDWQTSSWNAVAIAQAIFAHSLQG